MNKELAFALFVSFYSIFAFVRMFNKPESAFIKYLCEISQALCLIGTGIVIAY